MISKPTGMIAAACLLAGCATNQGATVSHYAVHSDPGKPVSVDVSKPADAAGVICWKEQRAGSRLLTTRRATQKQREADAAAAQELTDHMKRTQARNVRGRY